LPPPPRNLRAISKLARGPGDLREWHGDLSRDAFLPAGCRVAESSTRHIRQSHSGDDLLVALRPSFVVESQRDGGIAVKSEFSRRTLWSSGTRPTYGCCRTTSFVRCGEALPAGSTHLIERPLPARGATARCTSSRSICRGYADAFDVRAGEGIRLPEIANRATRL